jgi:UPF0755 protein
MNIFYRMLDHYRLIPNHARIFIITAFVLIAGISVQIVGFLLVPSDFPVQGAYTIARGDGLAWTARSLEEESYIKSPYVFKAWVYLLGNGKIQAGEYYFPKKIGAFSMALRLVRGDTQIPTRWVTIREGLNVREIAEILSSTVPNIKKEEFIIKAEKYEGYLFPDTYRIPMTASVEDVIALMKANFDRRIATVQEEIKKFGKSQKDVIIMASIIEDEGRSVRDRQMIAGLLWKRLREGWPLQVDAAFQKVNGKTLSETITKAELRDSSSPFNTYANLGLPPAPITNPGLGSIRATVNPIETTYYFYLSEKNGTTHFSRTLEEHVVLKNKYLR